MNSEKLLEKRMTMQILLSAQEELMDLPPEVEIGDVVQKIDKLIMEAAADMMTAYEGKQKKSEMACNCASKKEILMPLEDVRKCFHTVADVVLNKFEEMERKQRQWKKA